MPVASAMQQRHPLRYGLLCLRANLIAGVRLAFGLRLELSAFRISIAQFLALNVLLMIVAVIDDGVSTGFDGRFNVFGLLQQMFFTLLFVLASFGLARLYRRRELAMALPLLLTAGELPIDVCLLALTAADAANVTPLLLRLVRWWLFLAWFAFMAGRSLAVALGPSSVRRMQRAVTAAALFTGLIYGGLLVMPVQRLWVQPAPDEQAGDGEYARVTSEQVLVEQPQLLDEALSRIEDERPGVTDLYFVGFAPYAGEDVFRKDVLLARDVLDQRFDTKGRSVLLINNRRTLLDTPMATVSNLRATLDEIGRAINADEDVVMVYLSSHGSPSHDVVVDFGPLELEQLTPVGLHRMLVESGIKWKIVVVSACYSGGFVEPLKDEYTAVITASQADRMSFGCGYESDATYFGDAYFKTALRNSDSFVAAFDQAKATVVERERKEGMSPPSNPQIYVGGALQQKLKQLESGIIERRSAGTH